MTPITKQGLSISEHVQSLLTNQKSLFLQNSQELEFFALFNAVHSIELMSRGYAIEYTGCRSRYSILEPSPPSVI